MADDDFQVTITSREIIKPSSPTIHLQQPYRLSCFDQLVPSTYIPLILFHSLSFDVYQVLDHGKSCLSEALTVFYPLSGRIFDNSFVHGFDAGVPFQIATVSSTLSRFLESHQHNGNYLNQLLPCLPFSQEPSQGIPLMTLQVNIFACGGIALGGGLCHKIGDSATGLSFARTWAAFFAGSRRRISSPDFNKGVSLFPQRTPMPEQYVSLIEKMWFRDYTFSTRRFFFSPESIASLRHQAARGGDGENGSVSTLLPTSVEALSGFLWKCFMAASRAVSGTTPRPSMVGLEVNLRKRAGSRTLERAFGNLFWPATAVVTPEQGTLPFEELVRQISDAVAGFDEEYVKSLQGEEGFRNIERSLEALREMLEMEPDVLEIGSVCNLGLDQMDFGAGDPGMVTTGDVRGKFSNFVTLAEARLGKGIEAWMIIEEERMGFMESDGEFLKYAVPMTNLNMSKL